MSKEEIKNESKQLEMRELSGGDIFPMLEIIDKLDCYDEIMELVSEMQLETQKVQAELVEKLKKSGIKEDAITNEMLEEQAEAQQLNSQLAVKVLKIVTSRLPKIKTELNTFLGKLTNTSAKTINDLKLAEYIKLVTSFFQKEELLEVFKSMQSLMG